ncbi:hypothetical protein D3C76_1868800 [compost metagenome]
MRGRQAARIEFDIHSGFFRISLRIRNARIVGCIVEKAADQRKIGAMALIRIRKRAVQR